MQSNYRRLYRSRTQNTFAGVCGGLGQYFNVDPVLVRLMAVGATLVTGVVPGLAAYLIAWLIMPLEPAPLPEVIDAPAGTQPTAG